jgi:hypothetical protein
MIRKSGVVADNFAELSAGKTEVYEILLALDADLNDEFRIGRNKDMARGSSQKQIRPKVQIGVRVVMNEDGRKLGIRR